ncbi:protoporphyrinogen oxidase [bacterium]|nr:protoporphyrinogen oxidase [bacterium]
MKTKLFDVVIAGAGLSGLSIAHFLKKSRPDLEILVVEKTSRAGGVIQSMNKDGFLAEWGPHGFLNNVEESKELLTDLGLMDEALLAPLKQFKRYICLDGKLKQIPQSPLKIISSDIMPFFSKVRVLADLWKKPRSEEQTVADWTAHRFGKAMLPFADVVMTGTFAGDIEKLSIDAAMPGLRHLELTAGSVFRGAIKAQKGKIRSGMPSMISFKNGVEHLINRLVEDKTIEFNSHVEEIIKNESGWIIKAGEKEFQAKQLVLALHINQALPILNRISPAPHLSVPEARIFNVVMGFGPEAEIPFGFGFLAPKTEKRFVLGTLFPSHMFPGRAPQKTMTLEALVGGIRNPEHFKLDDSELIEKAYNDIKKLIKLPKPPVFSKVLRTPTGIPQLEIGHHAFQTYRDRLENEQSGLHICGFGWDGIGTNDMIKHARLTARNLIEGKPEAKDQPKAKGIYV